MRIRRFRDSDEDAVLNLWESTGIGRPWLDLRSEIHEKRKRDRSLFLVALEKDRMIGCVMGAYHGRRGWVYHLAVDPLRQRSGIGRALMAAVERAMLALGVIKVNLQVRPDNLGVVDFYRHIGYELEPRTDFAKWLRAPESSSENDD